MRVLRCVCVCVCITCCSGSRRRRREGDVDGYGCLVWGMFGFWVKCVVGVQFRVQKKMDDDGDPQEGGPPGKKGEN